MVRDFQDRRRTDVQVFLAGFLDVSGEQCGDLAVPNEQDRTPVIDPFQQNPIRRGPEDFDLRIAESVRRLPHLHFFHLCATRHFHQSPAQVPIPGACREPESLRGDFGQRRD